MMRVERTPPGSLPVDIAAVLRHLRIDPSDGDQLLEAQAMADTAAAEIEHRAQIALLTQRITVTLDAWPIGNLVRLPIGPVQPGSPYMAAIDAADLTILEPSYGRRPGFRLDPAEWSAGPVEISYEAGFGDSVAAVPPDLQLAILDQAAAFYDARGAIEAKTQALSPHAARIAARYRGVAL